LFLMSEVPLYSASHRPLPSDQEGKEVKMKIEISPEPHTPRQGPRFQV